MQGQVLHSTFGYFIQHRIFYINDVFTIYQIKNIIHHDYWVWGGSPSIWGPRGMSHWPHPSFGCHPGYGWPVITWIQPTDGSHFKQIYPSSPACLISFTFKGIAYWERGFQCCVCVRVCFLLTCLFRFFPVYFTSSLYRLSLFTIDTDWDTYNQEMWQKVINWITGCKKLYTTHEHIQMYSKGKHLRIMVCPRPLLLLLLSRLGRFRLWATP